MFKENAVIASEKYYNFLKKVTKGMDTCEIFNIKRKNDNFFILSLQKPLKLFEGI